MMELIDKQKAIYIASGYCHWSNIPKELEKLPTVQAVPIEEVLKIIELEEKWLSQTNMSIRDIDIAFNAMKSKIKQIEGSGE